MPRPSLPIRSPSPPDPKKKHVARLIVGRLASVLGAVVLLTATACGGGGASGGDQSSGPAQWDEATWDDATWEP